MNCIPPASFVAVAPGGISVVSWAKVMEPPAIEAAMKTIVAMRMMLDFAISVFLLCQRINPIDCPRWQAPPQIVLFDIILDSVNAFAIKEKYLPIAARPNTRVRIIAGVFQDRAAGHSFDATYECA